MIPIDASHQPSYFLWATLSLFASFVLYIVYKIILKPLIRMQHYRKQGADCYFFPLIGQFRLSINKVLNKGDAKMYMKVKPATEPARYTCTNLGTDAYVLIHDTALIKEYYLNTEHSVKDPVFLEIMSDLLGKGLLTAEGSQWKAQRKILSNSFHFEFLKSILPTIQKTAHDNLAKLQGASMKNVNIMDVYQDITGQVVGKIFFGEQLDSYDFDGKPLTLGLASLISDIGTLNISPERHILGTWFVQQGFIPKHRRLMQGAKKFRNVCRDIVAERKRAQEAGQANSTKDMLDLLLEYKGEEGKMSDDEIIDQFITFFLAGMDTTGHLITMATYYLHTYPEIKEKMLQEVREVYRDGMTIDDLNKMEYTTAVLKESLRTSTPVPGLIPRRVIKDHTLKDIKIRKGDLFNIEFFYSNFNPEHFEDPHTFNPERWLNKDKKSLEAYTFIPFSGGPRNCIGQHLSLIEARIILAEFLIMYDFSMREGYQLEMMFKFLYEPAEPILLTLNKKND